MISGRQAPNQNPQQWNNYSLIFILSHKHYRIFLNMKLSKLIYLPLVSIQNSYKMYAQHWCTYISRQKSSWVTVKKIYIIYLIRIYNIVTYTSWLGEMKSVPAVEPSNLPRPISTKYIISLGVLEKMYTWRKVTPFN